ncbi:MAG: hypothetical protein M3378_04030 [Actinomycetota bacterium]|nr:hypothetical protein [Actinomycetota bacterium]MDQ3679708.1 hypothetical protein [Actinomycetota bacterium]
MLFAAVCAALRRRRCRRTASSTPSPAAPSLAWMLGEEAWLLAARLGRRAWTPGGALTAATTAILVVVLLGDMTPGPVAVAPARYGLAVLTAGIVLLWFEPRPGTTSDGRRRPGTGNTS